MSLIVSITNTETVALGGFAMGAAVAAGLAAALWALRATRRGADRVELTDGAVLMADTRSVVRTSAGAEALLGQCRGRPLPGLLRQRFGIATAEAEAAVDRLLREGTGFRTLLHDDSGAVFEAIGEPRGALVRLTLRDVGPAGAAAAEMAAGLAASGAGGSGTRAAALADLLSGVPVAIWSRDAAGKLEWTAGGLTGETGVPLAERAARTAAEKAPDEPSRRNWFRLELPEPDGGSIAVLDAVEVPDFRGGRTGVAVDASAALVSERTLARFVRTMTETFAHLTVGMAIFDRNETLIMFNPALAEMWQSDPAWLARRPSLREILDGLRASRRIPETADFHAWRRRLTDLFQNTDTAHYEELWHLADGSDIRVLAQPHPHGSLAFIFDDVTERLRLEQQFRHSIDLRRATLDRLDEGLAVFGPDGLLQLVNSAFHEIWGTDTQTVHPGMHTRDLVPLIQGLTVETDIWARLTTFITGEATRESWTARMTMGNGRILSGRFAPLPDGSTMAVFGDVTDSERIALALRERNEALESAEEMRAAVLDQISHRLRTPLNTIFGFAQLIADSRFGELNPAQQEYARGMLDSARHLLTTVDEVTELAALEIDPLEEAGSGVPLADMLVQTGRLLERRATEEGVRLRVVPPEHEPDLACEPGRLRQIVFSMMADAVGRCRGGGAVELGVRAGPDGASDGASGGGTEVFINETLPPGNEADAARAESESLALPVLRRLMVREGGRFRVEPGPGEGMLTIVCAFPPRAEAAVQAPEPALEDNRLTPGADIG